MGLADVMDLRPMAGGIFLPSEDRPNHILGGIISCGMQG